MTQRRSLGLNLSIALLVHAGLHGVLSPALALPPPEDQPEEVLRTEIILDARSPIDGKPMTPAEYAELQAQMEAEARRTGVVSPEVRRLITLLRIRKVLRTILPFLP